MAYQPIQMPGESPMARAMSDLGGSIAQLGNQRRQSRLDDELHSRQEQQDFQATLLKAKQLAEQGDMAGAQALMAPYKAALAEQGGGPPPPAMPPPMQEPPRPPQGGSPLPDSMEFGNNPSSDFDLEHGQPAAAMPPPPAAAPPEPIEPPQNPVMAARQAQLAQQQAASQERARTVLNFTGPGGVAGSIDPEATRQGGLERRQQDSARRVAQFDKALEGTNNPLMQKYGPELRSVIAMSGNEVDSTDILHYVQGRAKEDADAVTAAQNKTDAAQAKVEERDFRHTENVAGREATRQNALIMAGAARTAAAERDDPNRKPLSEPEKKASATAERLAGLADELDTMPPMADEDRKIVAKDAANSEALDKHENVKAIATSLDQVKPLSDKLSPEGRRYYAHIREIASVLLRKESGAAISADETQNVLLRYVPAIGDTPADVAQKRSNLRRAIAAIGAEGVRTMPGQAPGESAPIRNPVVAARAAQQGKRAAEGKRAGNGTAPKTAEDYLKLLDGGH